MSIGLRNEGALDDFLVLVGRQADFDEFNRCIFIPGVNQPKVGKIETRNVRRFSLSLFEKYRRSFDRFVILTMSFGK